MEQNGFALCHSTTCAATSFELYGGGCASLALARAVCRRPVSRVSRCLTSWRGAAPSGALASSKPWSFHWIRRRRRRESLFMTAETPRWAVTTLATHVRYRGRAIVHKGLRPTSVVPARCGTCPASPIFGSPCESRRKQLRARNRSQGRRRRGLGDVNLDLHPKKRGRLTDERPP
jgi:hypothetical protein